MSELNQFQFSRLKGSRLFIIIRIIKLQFTLTIVGTFGVGHFGGRVVGADEAGELPLEWLIGAVMTRLAYFVDNIEEGSNGAIAALGPRLWIERLSTR